MTIPSFTDPTVTYETTATSCTCPDWTYRGSKTGKPCKHMVLAETSRAATFLALKQRFDVRNNPHRFSYTGEDGQRHQTRRIDWDKVLQPSQRDAERTAYLNWELSMGL